MIAIKRLQSIFWALLVTLGALTVYFISLRVATERNELARVEAQIYRTKGDIRYLETEFGARASMRQLEMWNAQEFRYSTPSADQYLDGERELANLDGIEANGPVYVAAPVMTAMVESKQDLPSAGDSASASPAASRIRESIAIVETAKAAEPKPEQASKPAPVRSASATPRPAPTPSPVARKAERMAMLDAQLLDERTLVDLDRKAAAEREKAKR